MPYGYRMQRYIRGPDGALHHDLSYVGENPWDESADLDSHPNTNELLNENPNLAEEQIEELKNKASEIDLQMEEGRCKLSMKFDALKCIINR